MKYSSLTLALFLGLSGTGGLRATTVINSPGNKVALTTDIIDGIPVYSVSLNGKTFVKDSPLGLKTNVGDFTKGMSLKEETTGETNRSYSLDNIKTSRANLNANTLKSTYTNSEGKEICVEWVVADKEKVSCIL